MHRTVPTVTILLLMLFSMQIEALSLMPSQKNQYCPKFPLTVRHISSPPSTEGSPLSRRSAFKKAFVSLSSVLISVPKVNALDLSSEREIARSNLLKAIQESKPEAQVMNLIQQLVPFSPEYSTDTLQDLDGEWKLIWSANDDFSPLLRLPYPLKPESFQYFGKAAAEEVGEGRVAQGLTGGIFGKKQLWLSSGIEPLDNKKGAFEIEPPFRLELGERPRTTNMNHKKMIIEAKNDGDFRKVNARTKEAQLAPKNIYEQIYLERNGKGSLRISTITDGDPVIVGAILIHEKL